MPMNMSYCRFENTFEALRECDDWLNEHEPEELSPDEHKYFKRLMRLASNLSEDFGDQV